MRIPFAERTLSYRDAVRLLGGEDEPIVRALGQVGGLASGATVVATAGAVDLFALRDQIVSWGTTLLSGLREKLTGVGRFDRTERLVAAHCVLVVTAFFEAAAEVFAEHGLDLNAAAMTPAEQAAIATGTPAHARYAEMIDTFVDTRLPIPTPGEPFEQTEKLLATAYSVMMRDLVVFLTGLSAFDRDGRHDRLLGLERPVADRASRRYAESFRRLAADIPEFAVWAGMVDAQATRAALTDLRRLLLSMSCGATATARRADLSLHYQAALSRPIFRSGEMPEHISLPTLDAAYVNPACRLAYAVGQGDQPASQSWWEDRPHHGDLQNLLVGLLTGIGATRSPIVVLGQPGSGKSVLTRILAARLPEADFLVVRVELRSVPADASIVKQIEESLHQALDEEVSWPDLVRSADGAMPVVILDGFDELLQATGMNRADYLEQVQEFQLRQSELGRPSAVIVTSRIAVADRTRFPKSTAVLRLEEFDESQVRAWLDVWNRTNRVNLASRGLRPLSAETAMTHPELATQPLLLLLLALYDSGANALQRADETLGRVELYERLFADFIRREVDRLASASQRERAILTEWRRLSAVAVAMLNRGADTITDAELDSDVPHLLGPDDLMRARLAGTQRALTVGQLLVGRFFFVHESRATRDVGAPEHSFEFLHATFGDFLSARLIVEALVDLSADREYLSTRRQPGHLDAGFFFALTSFATVTRRAPLREFCLGLIRRLDAPVRARCFTLVVELLADAGYAHPTWSLAQYEPLRRTVSARHAAFSANLVWLAIALADGPVDADTFFEAPAHRGWTEHALLWTGQLSYEDHEQLWQALRVEWQNRPDEERSVLTIRHEDAASVSLTRALPVEAIAGGLIGDGDVLPDVRLDPDSIAGRTIREAAFHQKTFSMRPWLLPLAEYWYSVGEEHEVLYGRSANGYTPISLSRALLALLLRPAEDMAAQERLALYRLAFMSPHERFARLVWRQLRNDVPVLGVAAVADFLRREEGVRSWQQIREHVATVALLRAQGLPLTEASKTLGRALLSAPPEEAQSGMPIETFTEIVLEEFVKAGIPNAADEVEWARRDGTELAVDI